MGKAQRVEAKRTLARATRLGLEKVFAAEKTATAFLLLLKKTARACRSPLAKRFACLRAPAIQAGSIAR